MTKKSDGKPNLKSIEGGKGKGKKGGGKQQKTKAPKGGSSKQKAASAEKVLDKIIKLHEALAKARDEKKRVEDAMKAHIEEANVEFQEAMERGRAAATTDDGAREAVDKLEAVESAWQELQDAKAYATEERKAAKLKVEQAEVKLSEAIEGSRQLDMFDGGAG